MNLNRVLNYYFGEIRCYKFKSCHPKAQTIHSSTNFQTLDIKFERVYITLFSTITVFCGLTIFCRIFPTFILKVSSTL